MKVKEFAVPGIPSTAGGGPDSLGNPAERQPLEFKRRRRTPPPPALDSASAPMMVVLDKKPSSCSTPPKIKKVLRSDSPTLGASEVSAAVREVKKSKYSGSLSS